MQTFTALLFLGLAGANAMTCPGSSAWIHAKCEISVTLPNADCASVIAEVKARAAGTDGWCDPHNKGIYTVDSATSSVLNMHRKTGNGKYTDKQTLTFSASGKGCAVAACSESQVTSVYDYSTNYCNLHDLYCGKGDGCNQVNKNLDLSFEENNVNCSSGQHDASACAKTCGPTGAAVTKTLLRPQFA